MQQDVKILPITEEHIVGLHKCLDLVARERKYLAWIQAPPLDSIRTSLLENIANHVPQFVAILKSEVIGWCDISPLKLEGFKHCGELGMGVCLSHRGLGIGEQLAIRTIQEAKEIGLERVELKVLASNIPAFKLYEKLGFKTEGKKEKARKFEGSYDDVIEMVLFI